MILYDKLEHIMTKMLDGLSTPRTTDGRFEGLVVGGEEVGEILVEGRGKRVMFEEEVDGWF